MNNIFVVGPEVNGESQIGYKKYMPDSELKLSYEGAKPLLPVTILNDRTALQNMAEEMYPELPKRKIKKKKA